MNELLSNLPNAFHITTSLRDFIRRIRAAKTAAEERAVIAKECAHIRNAFKSDDNSGIHKNMPKLLYIHMLGYPTHFGQMECIRLISSQSFPEKRIGYLALMLLMDENQELLMLVTNSLKNDINSANPFIAGLALAAVGNISSEEMARDLAPDVMKLLTHVNQNIKKRAAAVLTHILPRTPELLDDSTANYFYKILNDNSDSVLLTGCEMITSILDAAPSYLPRYREKCAKKLVKMLRSLLSAPFHPNYDIQGIKDPFLHASAPLSPRRWSRLTRLQISILKLMRKLGAGDEQTSALFKDILNDYCNFIEGTNSTQEAILYECVLVSPRRSTLWQTIFGIPCSSSCRDVGMFVIGRFLTNANNNARYVALSTLKRIVKDDPTAASAHESIILQCLYDGDQSIRSLAFDIALSISSPSNVKTIVPELLIFLSSSEDRDCSEVCDQIMGILVEYGTDAEFKLCSLITMMQLKGAFVSEGITRQAIHTLISHPQIQKSAVHRVFLALRDDPSQSALTSLGLWCMGEYGALLRDTDAVNVPGAQTHDFDDILDLIDHLLRNPAAKPAQLSQLLTTCMKILVSYPQARARVQAILNRFRTHSSSELQQRAEEYGLLLDESRPSLLSALFSGLSAEFQTESESGSETESEDEEDLLNDILGKSSAAPKPPKRDRAPPPSSTPAAPKPASTSEFAAPKDGADDEDSFFNGSRGFLKPAVAAAVAPDQSDLLGDLLSSFPLSAPSAAPHSSEPFDLFGSPAPSAAPAASSDLSDLMNLFPSGATSAAAAPVAAPAPSAPSMSPGLEVFRNEDLLIRFSIDTDLMQNTTVSVEMQSRQSVPLLGVLLQVAVPKFLSIKMDVPSGTELHPGGTLRQRFLLTSSAPDKKKAVKARISYSLGSQPRDAQFTFNQFL